MREERLSVSYHRECIAASLSARSARLEASQEAPESVGSLLTSLTNGLISLQLFGVVINVAFLAWMNQNRLDSTFGLNIRFVCR